MADKEVLPVEQKPKFDSEFSPANPHNRDVSEKLGVQYDTKKKFYVDNEGGLTHDRFGQPL